MDSYFGVFVVIAYLVSMFICTGYIVDNVFGLKMDRFFRPVFGAVVYFFILAIVYIPIQFTNKSLSLFSNILIVISIGFLVCGLLLIGLPVRQHIQSNVFAIKDIILSKINSKIKTISINRMIWIIVFVSFFIFLIYYTVDITYYASYYDSSYYNGIINSTVESGLLNTKEPYLGNDSTYTVFNQFMLYESFVAAISKIFSIHPLIVVNRVIGICEVLANSYIFFLIARKLFKDYKKAICTAGLVFYINTYMNTIYTSANFLFYRLAEAKSITANITVPLLILISCYIFENKFKQSNWTCLYMISVVGLMINDTAMILIPATLFALLVPINIKAKNMITVINSAISFLPCLVFVLFYVILG